MVGLQSYTHAILQQHIRFFNDFFNFTDDFKPYGLRCDAHFTLGHRS